MHKNNFEENAKQVPFSQFPCVYCDAVIIISPAKYKSLQDHKETVNKNCIVLLGALKV